MTHDELTGLLTENMRIMNRIAGRLNNLFSESKKSRQQMFILMRLYLSGKIKLRDFANLEVLSTANLCSILRKLESENLVVRTTDKDDHRDTWYQVSKSGQKLAETLLDKFMTAIQNLCQKIPQKDAEKLVKTIKTTNEILLKMELANA